MVRLLNLSRVEIGAFRTYADARETVKRLEGTKSVVLSGTTEEANVWVNRLVKYLIVAS